MNLGDRRARLLGQTIKRRTRTRLGRESKRRNRGLNRKRVRSVRTIAAANMLVTKRPTRSERVGRMTATPPPSRWRRITNMATHFVNRIRGSQRGR